MILFFLAKVLYRNSIRANQIFCELFRNLFPNQLEPIGKTLWIKFDINQFKTNPIQSGRIQTRFSIWMNPSSGWFESTFQFESIRISPTSDLFGFKNSDRSSDSHRTRFKTSFWIGNRFCNSFSFPKLLPQGSYLYKLLREMCFSSFSTNHDKYRYNFKLSSSIKVDNWTSDANKRCSGNVKSKTSLRLIEAWIPRAICHDVPDDLVHRIRQVYTTFVGFIGAVRYQTEIVFSRKPRTPFAHVCTHMYVRRGWGISM